MKAQASQRKQLYRLFQYNKENEAFHVQQTTGDPSKNTAADLSMSQATKLIRSLTQNWAVFDSNSQRHRYILSLLMQNGWIKMLPETGKEVADMGKLSNWLKSKKSPVVKPLQNMSAEETSKIIVALENMVVSNAKKKIRIK
tara:strand:+ start:113 stop:538 length:426 start_codon:yes stop_codon:yes gene_type:complete